MKPRKNAIEQRLGGEQAVPGEQAAYGTQAAYGAQDAGAQQDPEFDALVDELAGLIGEGKLPEGFDLRSAVSDPALVALMQQYGAAAGIRIYAAEKKAEAAEQSAMQRASAEVQKRAMLPRSSRGGNATAGSPNYRSMSSEAFRELLQQMKKTARDGGRTRL